MSLFKAGQINATRKVCRMLTKATATDASTDIKIQKVCACKYLFALNIYSNRARGAESFQVRGAATELLLGLY